MKKIYTLFAFVLMCALVQAQVMVTFAVDMTGETVSANGVHLAGAFQGWDPAATAATDADEDGIYEVTLSIAPDTYEYKFVNDNAWGNNECGDGTSQCGDCGVDDMNGGHNRVVTVPAVEGYKVAVYKYNSCEVVADAVNIVEPTSTITALTAQPNPFTNSTIISLENVSNDIHDLVITTMTGQVVRTIANVRNNTVEVERGNLANGIYFASFRNTKGELATLKLVVQ